MSGNEIRPGRATGAAHSDTGRGAEPILVGPADIDAFLATEGALCVLVETPGSKWRRRVYLSLRAAENAIARARQRGLSVRVVLVRLSPCYQLAGTAQSPLDGPAAYAADHTSKAARTEVLEALRPGPTHSSDLTREGQA